jgi:hypothetical protein
VELAQIHPSSAASLADYLHEQIQEAQRMLDKLPQGAEFVADGQGKSFLIYEKKPVISETQLDAWATELNT